MTTTFVSERRRVGRFAAGVEWDPNEPAKLVAKAIEAVKTGHFDAVRIYCLGHEEADAVRAAIPHEFRDRVEVSS